MNTGYIKITIEEGKTPTVEAKLVDNNVWMSKWDMLRLFVCFGQKIEMNLRSIFKNRLLVEDEVTYTYRYTDSDSIDFNFTQLLGVPLKPLWRGFQN